jgi:hypothetical protein
MSITRASVAVLASTSALTRASISRICSAVTGALCAKSKRVRSALTSEPFCCTWPPSTSRKALCMMCVTEWLRMVAARTAVSTCANGIAHLQAAGFQHAVVAEYIGLDLERVFHGKAVAACGNHALVADLAAGFGVEGVVSSTTTPFWPAFSSFTLTPSAYSATILAASASLS